MTQDFVTSKQEKNEMKQLIGQMQALVMKSRQPGRSSKKSGKRPKGINGKMMPLGTSGPVVNDMFTRKSKASIGKGKSLLGVSTPGVEFLKAAFAAPDFANQGAFQGIPDEKTYKVVPMRHLLTADLDSLGVKRPSDPGQVLAIAQLPVPGVAFYWFTMSVAGGITPSTIFHPVYFNTYASIFGYDPIVNTSIPKENSNQVVEFRMAANTIELICTSNALNWTGSLRAFKCSAQLETCQAYTPTGTETAITVKVSGLTGAGSTGAASFVTPSNMGVFMSALNKEVNFGTKPILDRVCNINDNDLIPDGVINGNMPGFGDLECNIIILEGTNSGANITTFTVRAWQAVEYVPNEVGSIVYEVARPSPVEDKAALKLYRELIDELPIAVTYFENDSFWKRLLGTVSRVGSTLSVIPGPWGALAGGIGGVSGTIASMIN